MLAADNEAANDRVIIPILEHSHEVTKYEELLVFSSELDERHPEPERRSRSPRNKKGTIVKR